MTAGFAGFLCVAHQPATLHPVQPATLSPANARTMTPPPHDAGPAAQTILVVKVPPDITWSPPSSPFQLIPTDISARFELIPTDVSCVTVLVGGSEHDAFTDGQVGQAQWGPRTYEPGAAPVFAPLRK